VASGAPEELSRKLSYSNRILLRVKGNAEDVLKVINSIDGVQSAEEHGIIEQGTVDIVVEAVKDSYIRESLFNALGSAELPILIMKSMDLTLEEVFLQVTTHDKEELENASNIQ
jgi:ABC-2 type transport system ATP-binding protein